MTSKDLGFCLISTLFIIQITFACKHNVVRNDINEPQLICGEESLSREAYYLRVMDKDGTDMRSPDTIIELEMQDNDQGVPESQQIVLNLKGCFKVEGKWATAYIFDFNKHQGQIVRLTKKEKGKIHDVNLVQISLEQQDYEFRECNLLREAETITDRMVYDLRDNGGKELEYDRYRAVFVEKGGQNRKLNVSEGSCVVTQAEAQGSIYASDGQVVLEYRVQGRIGESEAYTRSYPNTTALTLQKFQEIFDQAQ